MFMNVSSHRGHMAVGKRQVTLCMTFSERELIPSYNRLQDRYGKLLHRYLSCLGDHQSTGAGGDATVLKGGVCVCVCLLEKMFSFFCYKCHSWTLHYIS